MPHLPTPFDSDACWSRGIALPGWSYLLLDGESERSEHPDGAGLPALEVTRAKLPSRGELIRCAQDRLRRVTSSVPDQLVRRGRRETMLREELLWAQPVVPPYRVQHGTTGHAVPCHHESILHTTIHAALNGSQQSYFAVGAQRTGGVTEAVSTAPSRVQRPSSSRQLDRGGHTRFRHAGSPSRTRGSAPPRPSLRLGAHGSFPLSRRERGSGGEAPRSRAPHSFCALSMTDRRSGRTFRNRLSDRSKTSLTRRR